MPDSASPPPSDRNAKGRFAPGNPGGPGRPRTISNYDYMLVLDEYARQASGEVIKVVIQQALAGNLKAADMLLKRQWPQRKGRPIRLGVLQDVSEERADAIEKFMPQLDEVTIRGLKGESPEEIAAALEDEKNGE